MPEMSPEDCVKLYEDAKTIRSPNEHDWQMAAAYCMPRHYAAWQTTGPASMAAGKAQAARRYAFDSTGVRALPKYVAILSRICTPQSQRWHGMKNSDPRLMARRAVQTYYDDLTKLLFAERYNTRARFEVSIGEVYAGLGVYGTGPMYIAKRPYTIVDTRSGPFYKSCALRDMYILVDNVGAVSHVFRRLWLNARQYKSQFGKMDNGKAPRSVQLELAKASPDEMKYFEFVHVVHLRSELTYDKEALDARRHPYVGYYLAVEDKEFVGEEHGFRSMPYIIPRTFTEPGDVYGYSPAMQAMAALGTVNATKKTMLKQGQKAVDPPLLAHDDGILSNKINVTPSSIVYGGMSAEGKALVAPLLGGSYQVGKEIIADERNDINDSFFVTLFQILMETPEMTATEVIERVAEKASLLAPTMGRVQSEGLGPTVEREIDVLDEIGRLPEMPPELIEANGQYENVWSSPMAKSMQAEDVSGFMRSLEMALKFATETSDPSPLDWYNLDVAIPEINVLMNVPTRWTTDKGAVDKKRQDRNQQQQTQQMIDAAPGAAQVIKATQPAGGANGQ